MIKKNIFFLAFSLLTTALLGQGYDVTTGNGEAVDIENISVTAEPTNLALSTANCNFTQGQVLEYLNCMVENNPVPGADYHLHLGKGDYLNGVSTLDLVLIMRHITGVDVFTDGSHLVAADVTADNKIDIRDLIEMRRLILGMIPEYTASESWRFFKSPSITVTGIGSETDLKFGSTENFPLSDLHITAVKIGDVNYSAQ